MPPALMSDQINVLIADDHPLFRQALAEALNQTHHNVVIDQQETLAATFSTIEKGETDFVLLDLKMPDSVGLMGLIELRKKHPEVSVVIVTANESSQTLRQVKSAGALGYLTKSMELSALIDGLNTLLDGTPFFAINGIMNEKDVADDVDAMKKLGSLTPKQQHVLSLISRGYLNKQIAYELDIKETTVKTHVSEIFKKLGIYNRTQAAIFNQYLNVPE